MAKRSNRLLGLFGSLLFLAGYGHAWGNVEGQLVFGGQSYYDGAYNAGERLTVSVDVTAGEGEVYDVYAAVFFANGAYEFVDMSRNLTDEQGIPAWGSGLSARDNMIFDAVTPPTMAPGPQQWWVVYVEPGASPLNTNNWRGAINAWVVAASPNWSGQQLGNVGVIGQFLGTVSQGYFDGDAVRGLVAEGAPWDMGPEYPGSQMFGRWYGPDGVAYWFNEVAANNVSLGAFIPEVFAASGNRVDVTIHEMSHARLTGKFFDIWMVQRYTVDDGLITGQYNVMNTGPGIAAFTPDFDLFSLTDQEWGTFEVTKASHFANDPAFNADNVISSLTPLLDSNVEWNTGSAGVSLSGIYYGPGGVAEYIRALDETVIPKPKSFRRHRYLVEGDTALVWTTNRGIWRSTGLGYDVKTVSEVTTGANGAIIAVNDLVDGTPIYQAAHDKDILRCEEPATLDYGYPWILGNLHPVSEAEEQANLEVAEQGMAAFAARDPMYLMSLMRLDSTLDASRQCYSSVIPFAGQYSGLVEIQPFYPNPIGNYFAAHQAAISSQTLSINRAYVQGNTVAFVVDETATVAATGNSYTAQHVYTFLIEEGTISYVHMHLDTLPLVMAMNVTGN